MSTIVQCACGAKVRVAADLVGQTVRCPRCKTALPAAGAAPHPPGETVGAAGIVSAPQHGIGVTCPICMTEVQSGEAIHRCPECDIVHHEECWAEVGGCGTFGCKQAPAVEKSEQSAQAPLTAWGDTKVCPVCGETIKSIALRCRFCGMEFSSVDPLSVADIRQQAVSTQQNQSFKTWVTAAFIASLPGCLAPITLIFGLAYLLPRREQLAKAGPLFSIMGWTSVALSGLYCVLMLLFYFLSG